LTAGLTLKPLKWNSRSHYSSDQRSPVRLLPVRWQLNYILT
jgi:hypothetical protein